MATATAPKTVRALIAPDKFKGSLTAGEVADALAAGLRSAAFHRQGRDGPLRTASTGGRRGRQRGRRRRLRLHPAQLHRRRTHRPACPGQHRVRRRHRRRRGGQHLRPRAPAGRNPGAAECLQPRLRRSCPVRPQPETGQDRAGPGRQRQHRRRHGNAHRPRVQLPRRRRPPALRQRRGAGADPQHPPDRPPRTGRHRARRRQRRPQPAARRPGRTGGLRPAKGRRTRGDRGPGQRPRTFRRQDDGGGIPRRGAAG